MSCLPTNLNVIPRFIRGISSSLDALTHPLVPKGTLPYTFTSFRAQRRISEHPPLIPPGGGSTADEIYQYLSPPLRGDEEGCPCTSLQQQRPPPGSLKIWLKHGFMNDTTSLNFSSEFLQGLKT